MQVIRKKLIDVIAWDTQARFIIPRWQRHYVWGEKEVLQMWSDWISDCAHNLRHFCGVMLFRQLPEVSAGWEIVDGQQRMTTFFLFFLALRDICQEDKIDFSELNGIFTLPGNSSCRLVLQEGMNEDRDIMNALLNQSVEKADKDALNKSALYEGYRTFRQKLADMDRAEIPGFVIKVLQNVDLVVLTVDEEDDTRRIFESLNSRGKQVSPDELLSNLITYIGADDPELNERARNVWSYVAERFDHDDLELFLETFGKRNGIQTERGTVFEEIKFEVDAALKSKRIKDWLKEFKRASDNYNDILYPGATEEPIEKMLSELKRLRVPKLNPFYSPYWKPFEIHRQVNRSFIISWLPWFACSSRTTARAIVSKNFLPTLARPFDAKDVSSSERLERVIKIVDEIWIDDATFRDRFIKKNIYGPGVHLSRLRYYLEKLEQKISENSGTPFEAHFGNQTTVEHIMPQTLDEGGAWKNALRISDPVRLESQHKGLVHTIGNLTVLLTKDNPAAGNTPYSQKRDFYIHPNQTLKNLGKRKKLRVGNCALNTYFENVPTWNFQTIVNRGTYLADLALKIWNKEDWNRETQ